jgi:hypothetical protein
MRATPICGKVGILRTQGRLMQCVWCLESVMLAKIKYTRLVGWAIAFVSALNLALIGVSLLTYPRIFEGSITTIVIPIVLVMLYGAVGIGVSRNALSSSSSAAQQALLFGIIAALWQSVMFVIEDFTDWLKYLPHNALALFPFVILFLWFALAGFRATVQSRTSVAGLAAALFSAIISILLLMTFVFIIDFVYMNVLVQNLHVDFLQSGMHDPRAYILFNSLDAASTHLILLPIIGAFVGIPGVVVGMLRLELIRPKNVILSGDQLER